MSSAGVQESDQSVLLSDTALAALALERQPFEEETGGETFIDESRTERLAEIRQALIAGDDLLLVLGERGAGKSTLLAQLAADSGLRIQCFSVRGGPRFSTLNLFVGMLEAFKVRPPEQLKETLDELIPCLQAMIGNDTLCVIVLDDAESLPADELTTLLSAMLYLNSGDQALLRVALAAPPTFEELIPDLLPRGADLPYASLVLEPYDMQRAGLYLAHRFEQAGMRGEFPFDEAELTAINERAGGRPGALHASAAAALEARWGEASAAAAGAGGVPIGDAAATGAPPPGTVGHDAAAGGVASGRTVRLALGALAALMIVGGLLLFGAEPDDSETRYRVVEERKLETERQRAEDEVGAGASGSAAADAPVASESASAPSDPAPLPSEAERAAAAESEAASPSVPDTAPGTDTARADAAAPAAEPSPAPGEDDPREDDPREDAAETAASEAPAEPLVVESPATGTADAEEAVSESSATTSPSASPAPGSERESEPEPEPSPAAEPSAPPPTDTATADPSTSAGSEDEAPAPAPAPDAANESGPRTDADLLGADEEPAERASEPDAAPAGSVLESPNWILVQDAESFTVQMIASTDRGAIEAFLSRAELAPPNSIFSFERRGQTWYALVHGLFPSIEAARTEIERMPPAALTDQPWIRAVGRVQNSLREQD